MATSKSANTYNRQMWEDSEFPILCQTCLGDNPYIRMTKEPYGKECKICVRPFTVFRWCPGSRMRFKKTEVCQTCSKLKNVCQTCLLDLEYGLPIQIRDLALKIKDDIPRSNVNKEYYIQNVSSKSDVSVPGEGGGKSEAGSELLMKLARTAPYYKRNRPHICSFWVKGKCRRGEECPYRHEKPTDPDDPLADQNIKDRYFGVNDPVAVKLMRRVSMMPKLETPEDKSITTLYVGNLASFITETDLKNIFYQYGEIRSIMLIPRQQCAFIEYVRREDAELAAEKTFNMLILGGRRVYIKWRHKQQMKPNTEKTDETTVLNNTETELKPSKNLPAPLPPLPKTIEQDYFNLSENIPVPPPHLPEMIPTPPVPPAFPPPMPNTLLTSMPHLFVNNFNNPL